MNGEDPDATVVVRPLLTVVRGEPTPEQLAALIAVVGARAATSGAAAQPAEQPLWNRPQLRTPLAAEPGAWRASGLPH